MCHSLSTACYSQGWKQPRRQNMDVWSRHAGTCLSMNYHSLTKRPKLHPLFTMEEAGLGHIPTSSFATSLAATTRVLLIDKKTTITTPSTTQLSTIYLLRTHLLADDTGIRSTSTNRNKTLTHCNACRAVHSAVSPLCLSIEPLLARMKIVRF